MIGDLMVLAVLCVEVVVLSRLDRRRFGTWVTPFTVLAYPFAAVTLLAYFLAPALDFVPLHMGSVMVWILGLFLIWAAGAFLGWGLLDIRLAPNGLVPAAVTPPQWDDAKAARWAIALSWAILPILCYGVVASVNAAGGWTAIGSPDFRDAYSMGLHGHAIVLAMLLGIVLIGLYRRGDKLLVATIFMLLVFLTLGRVKGTILQVIFGGVLFRMMQGRYRLTFRKVAVLLGATYVMFNIVYLIGMSVFFSDYPVSGDVFVYLGRHYLYYLFAGVLGFSEAMRSGVADVGGDWHTIFAPFLNVGHAAFGGSMVVAGSTHEKGMGTDLLSDLSNTNVYTMFGTLHLYLGLLGAAAYVFVAGLLCYGFLLLVKNKNNAWLTAGYCLIAAELSLGFFEYYFWHLTPYEIIAMGALLALASRWNWRSSVHRRLAVS